MQAERRVHAAALSVWSSTWRSQPPVSLFVLDAHHEPVLAGQLDDRGIMGLTDRGSTSR